MNRPPQVVHSVSTVRVSNPQMRRAMKAWGLGQVTDREYNRLMYWAELSWKVER